MPAKIELMLPSDLKRPISHLHPLLNNHNLSVLCLDLEVLYCAMPNYRGSE